MRLPFVIGILFIPIGCPMIARYNSLILCTYCVVVKYPMSHERTSGATHRLSEAGKA